MARTGFGISQPAYLTQAGGSAARGRVAGAACALSVVLALLASPAAGETPATQPAGPDFAAIYGRYMPDFAVDDRTMRQWRERAEGAPDWPKYSLQARFDNRAHVEQDWRVPPIVKRADELMAGGEYREAARLYQHVIEKYGEDLWPVAEQGVFVPTTLYCQRQLLKLPQRELDYYRTVYDPYARALFEKARRHCSLLDFAYVAERYSATSYGALALYELGNAAMDSGNYEKARHCYEQIRNYHRTGGIDAGELDLRLLICCRRLGEAEAAARLGPAVRPARSEGAAALKAMLKDLDAAAPASPQPLDQRASPDALSLGDYTLFEPLKTDLSTYDSTWTVRRELGWRFRHPDNLTPVIAGNNLLYKDKNILYCRSLLTGELKWQYAEGGLVWDFERIGAGPWSAHDHYPCQDLAVWNGMVYTFIVKGSPSLVAIDLATGERRWAAGPMAASSPEELDDRYACRPAVGEGRVYATVVHDEVEGASHLSSTAGVAAFEARTGKLLWRRTLCRVTPSRFTISAQRRKIRIFCSPPVYAHGVVYACTNAGVLAALDADTGEVRWVTRYEQRPVMLDATVLPETHSEGEKLFATNTAPILWGAYLLALPVDHSGRVFCLDRFTGRVLWSRVGEGQVLRMVGVWQDIVIQGGSQFLVGWHIPTGRQRFRLPLVDGGGEFRRGMQAIGRDGRIHSSGWYVSGTEQTYYDVMVSLKDPPEVVARRTWYNDFARGANPQRIRRGEPPRQNEEPFFLTKSRMGLRLWGTPAEIEVDAKKITMRYDVRQVQAALQRAEGLQAMYDRAELHQFFDRRDQAIAEFQQLRDLLGEGKDALRIEVNRQLFGLYLRQAQAALAAGDNTTVEKYVALMATCPTSSHQEILTALGLAEQFDRRGENDRAAECLLAVLRHYRSVPYPMSSLVNEDSAPLIERARGALGHLLDQSPRQFFQEEVSLAGKCLMASVTHYFSLLAPIEPDCRVETGQFAGDWLRRLLPRASAGFRRRYEQEAQAALAGPLDAAVRERLIREHPSTPAAQAALDAMADQAGALPAPARNVRLWQLEELAALNGLKLKVAAEGVLKAAVEPPAPLAEAYENRSHRFEVDDKTGLRLLERRGGRAGGQGLLFLGVRSTRLNAVKHGVICFDASAGKPRWARQDIRLGAKGEEAGFARVIVHQGRAIVHGRYDVLAFDLGDGKDAWHFRVPHEFQIESATPCGDLLVLSSRLSTLAIHTMDGSIVWEASEQGELYCPPRAWGDTLLTVRLNPSGVSFRSLSTGRLIVHLEVPGLTQNRAHPVLKAGGEDLPVGFDDGLLVLTDGWDYIGIDAAGCRVRWRIRIQDVDRDQLVAYRLAVRGGRVLVLKQEYDTPAVEMFHAGSGERLWHTKLPREVFYSPVMDEQCVYGLTWQRDRSAIELLGRGLDDGKGRLAWTYGAYDQPEIFLDEECHGPALVARVNDRQGNYGLVAVNVRTKKLIHDLSVKGHGLWGNYGEVSSAIQGPILAVLSKDVLTWSVPK